MADTFTQVLTQPGDEDEAARWTLSSHEVAVGEVPWRVTRRRLRGGLADGVETIAVENGRLRFTVVPTRGMNIWDAHLGELRIGWQSPVRHIVHPKYVDPSGVSGMGWHAGFGEWVTRGGLEWFGSAGQDGRHFLSQHGRISNLPANRVEVRIEPGPPPRIVVRGELDEAMFPLPALRLVAEISTVIGSTTIELDDTIVNLADVPQEFQSLYHVNYGAPLLGRGARFLAPVRSIQPIRAHSGRNELAGWNDYLGPQPVGYRSDVYMLRLHADAAGMSEAVLSSAGRDAGITMRYDTAALPCFTLWKNEGPVGTGYVTGLEPGTSHPLNRSVEREHGRVPVLAPAASHRARLDITIHDTPGAVAAAEARVGALQAAPPEVLAPLLPD